LAFLEVDQARLRTEVKKKNDQLERISLRIIIQANSLDFYEGMIINLKAETIRLNKIINDKD